MNFELSKGGSEHAAGISRILSDWIDQTDWMPRIHTREEDAQFGTFLVARADVTVAIGKSTVIGFLALRDQTIHALYVDASARRNGIGHALIQSAKTGRDGLDLWVFQANRDAYAFYQAEGFTEIERTNGEGNDEKLPDVRMQWKREMP